MPACCICYTTDPTYLFPTFVSAIQARHHAARDTTDVAIFSFDADAQAEQAFGAACAAENIRFVPVKRSTIDNAPVMLARLFLNRFVSDNYEQLLYIDGDTQITGSLNPILDTPVADGSFLAANDPMTFAVPGTDRHSQGIMRHFAAMGFSEAESSNYFNTGVLRIARQGWDAIGLAAWELFNRNAQASRFPDQDVLNIVGGPHHRPMSLAWNFPIFMMNANVERQIAPRIYHFMSNPKPWHGVFPPWAAAARLPYLDAIRRYPALVPYLSVMPAGKQLKYHLQQRYKWTLETFTWRLSPKRARILEYERGVAAGG